jgi:hypothetical protein
MKTSIAPLVNELFVTENLDQLNENLDRTACKRAFCNRKPPFYLQKPRSTQ